MKHLLIPIKDIENKIESLQKEKSSFEGKTHLTHLESLQTNIDALKYVLNLGRQISLNAYPLNLIK